MELICKMLGGSHSYGLNTPASDIDNRGVFLNQELSQVVGLRRVEHSEYTEGGADDKFKELRAYFNLLRGGNTEALEMLFNDDWLEVTPFFLKVQTFRRELLDSARLFACLRGYMQGELRLALGLRKGALGGKRKEAVDKYGFSPKNFVQLYRLAWAGVYFFQHSVFPVNIRKHTLNSDFADGLVKLKTQPETFTVDLLQKNYNFWEENLAKAFERRREDFKFNADRANELAFEAYWPFLKNKASSLQLI